LIFLSIIFGIALLLIGGEALVRGAASLALRLHIPPMIIGLTIISFSTSAPELVVSLEAALDGLPDMAVGNVVGSNLSNIGLILGITAIFFRLDINISHFKRDWLFLLGFSILYFILLLDGSTDFLDGLLLSLTLAFYLFVLIRSVRKGRKSRIHSETSEVSDPLWKSALFIFAGLIGLKFGAQFLVKGSVELANIWGVSERVISLTIVSIGTSLPELAASLISAYRGQREMALGNVIGSNIFNIGSVIGFSSMIIPIAPQSAQIMQLDYPWMMVMTLLIPILLILNKRYSYTSWKGGVLLLGYIAYMFIII
jgi:cation:H+ antiporter